MKVELVFFRFSAVLLMWLATCPVSGQGLPKKTLEKKDYALWSRLIQEGISSSGNWVSFYTKYENGADTLFVKGTLANASYAFPKGHSGQFSGDRYFACLKKDTLIILNLEKGISTKISNVSDYKWADSNCLIYAKAEDGAQYLMAVNAGGKAIAGIAHVTHWTLSPDKNFIAFSAVKDNLSYCGLLDLKACRTDVIFRDPVRRPSEPVWEEHGRYLSTILLPDKGGDAQTSILLYDRMGKQQKVFDPSTVRDFPVNYEISTNSSLLHYEAAENKLFFGMALKVKPQIPTGSVQVWNTFDKWIYPQKIEIDDWNAIDKIGLWDITTGGFMQITDNCMPKIMLAGNGKFAIRWNPQAYEPQFRFHGNVDYEILNIRSGQHKTVLENFPGTDGFISLSPNGAYTTYFHKGQWHAIEVATSLKRVLTADISAGLSEIDHDRPEAPTPYGAAGWSSDGIYFLFYDQFDLWKVKSDGTGLARLTQGREKQIEYRLASENMIMQYDGNVLSAIDLNSYLLLQSSGHDGKTGLCYLLGNTQNESILESRMLHQGRKAPGNTAYTYIGEDYNTPPALYIKRPGKPPKEIYQSNKQHAQFYWGESMLVSYTTSTGKQLQGILYAPANRKDGVVYPMIVEIYQQQLPTLHRYIAPSDYNTRGFNVSNFTSQGFYVLKPDIRYEVGSVGPSALDCTLAAVGAACRIASVDRKKIGLIGHSMGGYETDYIITQTDTFAAAVAGAAITDFTSCYFGMGWNYGMPEWWRFEHESLRMGMPFFEDSKAYLDNSPVMQAKNVSTPLLSWSGSDDRIVDYYQSIEFYNALRRLGKEHIFLVYPGEKHVLMAKAAQKDLALRIEQWFSHHLLSKSEEMWMRPDYIRD